MGEVVPPIPYYEHDGITIYHADMREVLLSVDADAAVTDPPYGVGRGGAKRMKERTAQRQSGQLERPGGYSFDDTPQYVASVVVPAINVLRERVQCVAVTPGTRNLWLYPPADDVGCFYQPAGAGVGRWGFSCSQPILYYGSDPYLRTSQGARANSHWSRWPNDANAHGHPCAKPLQMMTWLVNRTSLSGETVIDPFMGSGTTLVAAKQLGRHAIGIEIEERYCEIAAKRLAQEVLAL